MTISATTQGLRPGVTTSSNRPATPFEGQMIYETDTDMVAVWNGTAWRYIAATTATSGTVLQVVAGTPQTVEVNNSTTTAADTGLTATITPKSNTSKILVSVNQAACIKASGNTQNGINLYLLRGASTIQTFAYVGLYTDSLLQNRGNFSTVYLDSPATTAATTYKTQFANFTAAASVAVQAGNIAASTIILQEIAG